MSQEQPMRQELTKNTVSDGSDLEEMAQSSEVLGQEKIQNPYAYSVNAHKRDNIDRYLRGDLTGSYKSVTSDNNIRPVEIEYIGRLTQAAMRAVQVDMAIPPDITVQTEPRSKGPIRVLERFKSRAQAVGHK